ncbi:hypothetical protein MAR_024117, partial [Mya arenaria]
EPQQQPLQTGKTKKGGKSISMTIGKESRTPGRKSWLILDEQQKVMALKVKGGTQFLTGCSNLIISAINDHEMSDMHIYQAVESNTATTLLLLMFLRHHHQAKPSCH